MEYFLSIIIPVYNAELFLERCVKSTLDSEDSRYEIILIDDGSMDGSWRICEHFQQTDSRVRVYHYRNNGVSAARNAGIEKAKGKMIFFLDADDYLEPGSVNQLLKESEQIYTEFVIFSYNFVNTGKKIKRNVNPLSEGKLSKDIFIRCLIISSDMNYCWGKLYKRKILISENIRFGTKLKVGEDIDFQIHYIQSIKHIRYINKALVNYEQNDKSVMHQYRFNKLFDLERMYYVRKKLIKQIKLSDDEVLQMYEDMGRILLSYIFRIRYTNNQAYNVYKLKKILERDCFIDILNNMPLIRMGCIRSIMLMLIKCRCYHILIRVIKVIRNLIL